MNCLALATNAMNTCLQIASFKMSSSVNQPDCRAAGPIFLCAAFKDCRKRLLGKDSANKLRTTSLLVLPVCVQVLCKSSASRSLKRTVNLLIFILSPGPLRV